MSFAGEVWQTLSKVNVSDHTAKKGSLTYLSWTWAWATLMAHYPESSYTFRPPVERSDGTCEVWVDVTVGDGEKAVTREMWLSVMDNRGAAVKNPDARKLGDARMRCLTKAIAMFGLGHYIYAGEDLPQSDMDEVRQGYTSEQKSAFDAILTQMEALDMWVFRKTAGDEVYAALNGSFDSGKKMENKRRLAELEKAAQEQLENIAAELIECIAADDHAGIGEFAEYDKLVKRAVFAMLSPEHKHYLEELKKAAA